jgi:hypothetical protein
MSWSDTNIITAATVKTETGTATGVQDKILDPAIRFAQRDLRQLLGETLYALVEAGDPVNDATLGANTALATLYNQFLKPYLSWKTVERSLPDMWAQADRNGVFQRNGDNYNTVGSSGLNTLIAQKRSFAEAYETDLLRYLKNLDDTDALAIAFKTDVDSEPRTTDTYNGRIISRVSPRQRPERG